MNLDPRIIEGKKPLTPFDIYEAKQFDGCFGYFSNVTDDFKHLENAAHGVLDLTFGETPYRYMDDDGIASTSGCLYFLPEEWVKEPEKKYRPYSLEEFLEIFGMGDLIYFKGKGCCDEVKVAMFTGYITDVERIDDKTPGACEVMLGSFHYSLLDLFKDFERFYNGRWVPFGVIEG